MQMQRIWDIYSISISLTGFGGYLHEQRVEHI